MSERSTYPTCVVCHYGQGVYNLGVFEASASSCNFQLVVYAASTYDTPSLSPVLFCVLLLAQLILCWRVYTASNMLPLGQVMSNQVVQAGSSVYYALPSLAAGTALLVSASSSTPGCQALGTLSLYLQKAFPPPSHVAAWLAHFGRNLLRCCVKQNTLATSTNHITSLQADSTGSAIDIVYQVQANDSSTPFYTTLNSTASVACTYNISANNIS